MTVSTPFWVSNDRSDRSAGHLTGVACGRIVTLAQVLEPILAQARSA